MQIEKVMLLIIYRCNLRCNYCFYSIGDEKYKGIKGSKREELTTDEIINQIIIPAKQMGVKKIVISGGEPFVRKDLYPILKFISRMGIKCTLQSNLALNIEEVLQDLEILKSIKFQVSLDGVREKNDVQRGTGSYEKTIYNIKRIVQRCKEENIKHRIQLNTVLIYQNIDSVYEYFEQMREFGINEFSFQLLSNNENNYEQNKLTNVMIKKLIYDMEQIKRIAQEKDIEVFCFPIDIKTENYDYLDRWYNTLRMQEWKGCPYIDKTIRISPYGDIFSCVETPFTNLKEHDLSEAIQSQERLLFIKNIKENGPIKECARCCNLPIIE